MQPFSHRIAEWQRASGRHTLPWQNTHDPYRIWLSEIMLQQTQVATVIPYYTRFLASFPTVADLAAADEEQVMALWAGLGYYTRARNLHACARQVVSDWGGRFPPAAADIKTLPGIGRSTAAAIAAFAYGERSPILDGNVKRVFARHFGIEGDPTKRAVEQRMWAIAQAEVPADGPDAAEQMRRYTQGLMDLGATLCTRGDPACGACPVRATCMALREARQHELPTPRERKAVPQRQTGMLVIEKNSEILLQRRPSPGIWGGLWSLPEFADGDAALACRQLGIEAAEAVRLPEFLHTFTHFKLQIAPWHVRAGALALRDAQAPQVWLPTGEVAQAALPAPVKKLLQGLFVRGTLL
ncbi:A/G-specific adenine glycosylase [Pigmentiphaga humi]|uniref:Adenine DNA glycosylase n=1 Tax=Pigmentiphaga humi TaxID=2478468 RepID=A0A3P4AXQ9_9BURK|nr:A/G-specific adenine glycosylase [Pigmentiphaga humi]VCU68859.1 A/G-specific adenine glycosylase [Pigmentiphaga humi]